MAANLFKEILNLLPGLQGKTFLKPFDEIIQQAIRKIDDESIIFWEPVSYIITTCYIFDRCFVIDTIKIPDSLA